LSIALVANAVDAVFRWAVSPRTLEAKRTFEAKMPIRLIIQREGAFTPEETEAIISAFEDTLQYLTWVRRDDAVALVIARQMIAVARQGERDPQKLRTCTSQP
jgi:hypothetical protein